MKSIGCGEEIGNHTKAMEWGGEGGRAKNTPPRAYRQGAKQVVEYR